VPSPSATTSYSFKTETKAKPNSGQFRTLTTGSPSITVNALPNNTSEDSPEIPFVPVKMGY
jgi:hypothetical protein